MGLTGREVEVLEPHTLAGMQGQVLRGADGGYLVSLHGESEEHEQSFVCFKADELVVIEYRDREPADEPRWLNLARDVFWFVCGFVVGAVVVHIGWLP